MEEALRQLAKSAMQSAMQSACEKAATAWARQLVLAVQAFPSG
jgi:hypothetical protein